MGTDERTHLHLLLPEFYSNRLLTHEVHVLQSNSTNYDMIMGRNLMEKIGLELSFKNYNVTWDDVSIPMKPVDCTPENDLHIHDPPAVAEATGRVNRILDANYSAADLDKVAREAEHLEEDEREQLRQLLKKYEDLFDGTLGEWNDAPLSIDLKEDAKPFHAKPYAIPKAYEETLKKEVARLCDIGVLKKVNRSEWAAPTFIVPKKNNTVRIVSDFRELNKRIKRKPYPIPKIQDLLLKLEGFMYASLLDLNMGYYHIKLDADARKLCTIVLPFGKFEYLRLPMGLCNSPDIFQERMSDLMAGLEFVRTYLDDLLVLTSGNWMDHLDKLDQVLQRVRAAGLKVNAEKSFFGKGKLEYLGYWVTRKGIQPLPKKVDAMLNIQVPKTKRNLRTFVGLINYYRDMWPKRSEYLAPLTNLMSKTAKWKWTDKHTKAFEKIKKLISKETLLSYPQFDKPFEIHTDASKDQLGAVIMQEGKPIAFYTRKLNPAQRNYDTTERELLAIVETLKEFRNILLGQQITVHTDHLNLTYKKFSSAQVYCWRLLLEEYGIELKHIKGSKNIVADALSRLENSVEPHTMQLINSNDTKQELMVFNAGKFASSTNETTITCPIHLKTIMKHQQQDKALLKALQTKDNLHLKSFCGGGRVCTLIVNNEEKIVVPASLQKKIVAWYHVQLCHPGETRTEHTIKINFTWNKLRETVHNICSICPTCQITKKESKKYGHLPEKQAEAEPWQKLCVDLIGPYKITNQENGQVLVLWCITMIDPATGWFDKRMGLVEVLYVTRSTRSAEKVMSAYAMSDALDKREMEEPC